MKQGNDGSSNHIIGKWKGWAEKSDSNGNTVMDYKNMIFDQGEWCGNKARETHVQLQCGWSEQVFSVNESPMCVYNMIVTTPLACIL